MLFKKKIKLYPDGTDELVRIKDIIIPQDFKKTYPQKYKLKRCKDRYRELGHLDSPIKVIAETNERGLPNRLIMVDDYTRLLLVRDYLKLEYAPVKYIDYDTYFEMKKESDAKYARIIEHKSKKSTPK